MEAGRGHLWVAAFLPGGEGWEMDSGIERVAREDLQEWTATRGVSLIAPRDPVGADEPLSEKLARCAERGIWPARRVDPASLVPLYTAPSQAERAHGLDLGEAIHRPSRPVSWED